MGEVYCPRRVLPVPLSDYFVGSVRIRRIPMFEQFTTATGAAAAPGEGPFQIGLSWEELIEWIWRVRTWRVAFSVTASAEVTVDEGTATFDMSFSGEQVLEPHAFTEERFLLTSGPVTENPNFPDGGGAWNYFFPPSTSLSGATTAGGSVGIYSGSVILRDGDTYYPAIFLDGNVESLGGFAFFVARDDGQDWDPTIFVKFDADFCGYPVKMVAGFSRPWATASWGATLSIQKEEWWSHGGRWNTSTGAPI